jgi:hypothetical protein
METIFVAKAASSKPKGRRRIMRRFELDEISAVDAPAQRGATVKIMKFGSPPLHAMPIDHKRVQADIRLLKAAGEHHRASQLEQALGAYARAVIVKRGEDSMQTLFDKAARRRAPASADTFELAGLTKEEREEAEEMLAAMDEADDEAEKADDPYAVDMGDVDMEAEKDGEEEEDPDDSEEAEALQVETEKAMADTDMGDEADPFSDDTEVGAEANKAMRDPRVSKRRALLMAMGRVAANRGTYQKVAFAKAEGRTSTNSYDPFHQRRGRERREQMDDRAAQHRAREQAEIDAMRGAFGREREERQRTIANMVEKLRTTDRRMPHTVALRKIRAAYPGLFAG